MGKITVETCDIEGLKIITPTVFGDERGYFMETYNYNDYKAAGIDMEFVQDNQSASKKGVLRGLHFQINYPQDKLVRVVSGEVFGLVYFCLQKIKSSSLFRKILRTDSWYCLIMRNLLTNAPISIIRTMRADWHGMTRILELNGRFRKAWS